MRGLGVIAFVVIAMAAALVLAIVFSLYTAPRVYEHYYRMKDGRVAHCLVARNVLSQSISCEFPRAGRRMPGG